MLQKYPARKTPGLASLYFSKRLRDAFASASACPLIVVEAPMGYGKTMAVREFLPKGRARMVWTPILGPSADACWRTFCRELERSVPETANAAEALSRLGFPHDSVRADAAVDILSRVDFNTPILFVFDDCHHLPVQESGKAFARFCELLAQSGLPGFRLACISRDAWPGDGRELLLLKGILACVGREAFALNPSEIREYYARCGVSLAHGDAAALHAATGGWISALYLHLLRHGGNGVFSRPERFNGPVLSSLMEKAVYAPLSPELKELLFALVPLERVSVEQADFLYGGDTHTLLAELASKNAFVFFNVESGIYSPHAMFRQYVLELFRRLPEKRRHAAHRKCGDWFMRAGEVASAMEAYRASGDFELALSALERDMGRNFVTENASFFTELFKACPEEILARHLGAAFKYAIAAFSAADFPAFGAQVGWLAKKCATLPPGAETDAWRGELEFLYSLAAFNDIEAMSVHHRRANALLGRPTGLFGPDSPWALGSPSVLFMFYRQSGTLRDDLRKMHECLPHYYRLARHHGAGGEYLMEAEALYNAGRFTEAEIGCHRGEAMATQHGQLGNVLCALFLRMRLALVSGDSGGDFGKARALVTAMRGLITKSRDYFLLHTVDLCEGWLYAALGRRESIPAWLCSELAEGSRLYAFARGFYYLVHGRALLLAGEYARVAGLFGHLLDAGLFRQNLLFSIHAHIFLAAAHRHLGEEATALGTLQKALKAAVPDEIYMPFAENHDVLGDLLEQACRDNQAAFAVIRALAGKIAAGRATALRELDAGVPPFGLSGREYETARLTAQGFSNQEIAETLFVSINTVKTHLKAAYHKTGAASRPALKKLLQ